MTQKQLRYFGFILRHEPGSSISRHPQPRRRQVSPAPPSPSQPSPAVAKSVQPRRRQVSPARVVAKSVQPRRRQVSPPAASPSPAQPRRRQVSPAPPSPSQSSPVVAKSAQPRRRQVSPAPPGASLSQPGVQPRGRSTRRQKNPERVALIPRAAPVHPCQTFASQRWVATLETSSRSFDSMSLPEHSSLRLYAMHWRIRKMLKAWSFALHV